MSLFFSNLTDVDYVEGQPPDDPTENYMQPMQAPAQSPKAPIETVAPVQSPITHIETIASRNRDGILPEKLLPIRDR